MTYTPEIIAHLQKHWNVDKTPKELAEMYGVKPGAMRQRISRLRAQGYVFTSYYYNPGTITQFKDGRIMIKESDGWRRLTKAEARQRLLKKKK